jgi:hypothetical protein
MYRSRASVSKYLNNLGNTDRYPSSSMITVAGRRSRSSLV